MKIKRYVAADMRAALRAIREEQGADAVILSTRRTSEGVEVCSAFDVELSAGQGTLAETAALKQLERTALQELERDAQEAVVRALRPNAPAEGGALGGEAALRMPAARGSLEVAADRTVVEELRSLRNLLEQQLAALAWNNFTRREPLKAGVLAELANLGLDRMLALQIVGDLPETLTAEQVQRMPYALLSRRIQVCEPPVTRAGAVALMGPLGAGKSTTLAKLAARYVLEHDAANLVLISSDGERLGSHEQLQSLGRVLGARVEIVDGMDELAARIAALPGRMLLIDMPGVSGRDAAAAAPYRALRARCAELQLMLVLPASAQSGVIEECITHFGAGVAHCCALTRLDEAVSLGGVLSALCRSTLPVAYVCDGPAIPDDLRPARAHQLVARGIELARQGQGRADDELLARRYGGNVNAAG
jgi:flagellar biosynthesis protein FlhF